MALTRWCVMVHCGALARGLEQDERPTLGWEEAWAPVPAVWMVQGVPQASPVPREGWSAPSIHPAGG